MSNKLIKDKTTEKCTVADFCKKYNEANIEQVKQTLIEKVMNPHYVPYEMKITICEKIIENSYYKKNNDGKIEKLYVNSPVQYMLYHLNIVNQYTNIKIDFSKALEEFNLLNGCGLLDAILNYIPEREMKEFRMILDMVENDVMQNEYEIHAFISNQVERFAELFGHISKPALDMLNEVLKNMDAKTIDKIFSKLSGLKGFNS